MLELKSRKLRLSENLILLNQEESEKVYILKRTINPIDLNSIHKKLAIKSADFIKSYLYDNEVAYIAVAKFKQIEIYRDFFGLSDTYYHFENDEYRFSETLFDFYSVGINDVAVEQYKRIGYVPAPNTIINKVKKIFPGEKIIIDLKFNRLKSIRKPISDIDNCKLQYSPETFKDRFESIFDNNMAQADGMLLSGGIDSSLIAYFLNKKKREIKAFTGISKDSRSSVEKERAEKTASLFCTSHKLIELNENVFEDSYLDVFKYMKEPFSDNAILGTAILAKSAYENGIKYIAEGEGGDELFGHAEKIKKYLFIRKFLPNKYIQKLSYPLTIISDKFKILNMSRIQLINRFATKDMSNNEFSDVILGEGSGDMCFDDKNIISLAILLSLNTGMEIPKNKLASAYSECNFIAPFLEINLLKLALIIPSKIKFKRERAVIKDLYEEELKRKEYDNKTIGMIVPTADWILDNHKDILFIDKFYKNEKMKKLIDNHLLKPSAYLDQKIWRVFVLNQWFEINKKYFF